MFFKKLYVEFIQDNLLTFIIYLLIILFLFPMEGLVLPNVYGSLFDNIKTSKFKDNPLDVWNNLLKGNVGGLMFAVILIWLTIILTDFVKSEIEANITPKYLQYVRNLFFEGTINKHDTGNFKDIKSGEYIARIMELSRNLRDSFQYAFSRFIPELIVTIMIIAFLYYKDPNIGKIVIFSFIICITIFLIRGVKLTDLIKKKETYFLEEISENLQNNFNNLMNVYINNNTDETISKNTKLEKHNEKLSTEIMNEENKIILSTQIITLLTYAIGIYYLFISLKEKKMSTANVIAYILLLGQYLSYVMDLNWGIVHNIIYRMGIVLASKDELEDIFSHIEDNKKEVKFIKNNIKIDNLSFKYSSDDTSTDYLFKDFTLNIKENEKIGIVGRSGSGKTTLMKMLVKLHEPTEGKIYIGDIDITDVSKKSIRNHVNYVNQKTNLFNDSLMFNLQYGNNKSEKEIEQLLKRYKLDDVYSDLNDGYKTDVGINGGNLSLGMQKVTTLVRGIQKPCGIIIFDEPLAGLDKNTREKTMKLIFNECKGKTIIIITHDQEILPYLDRTINVNENQKK